MAAFFFVWLDSQRRIVAAMRFLMLPS